MMGNLISYEANKCFLPHTHQQYRLLQGYGSWHFSKNVDVEFIILSVKHDMPFGT